MLLLLCSLVLLECLIIKEPNVIKNHKIPQKFRWYEEKEEKEEIYNHTSTFSETTLKSARNMAHVPHPPSSSGLPTDRLHAPVIYTPNPHKTIEQLNQIWKPKSKINSLERITMYKTNLLPSKPIVGDLRWSFLIDETN